MTHNEKDLLLKDLCARLPYGVKFKYEDRPNVCEILSITPVYNNGNVVYFDKYVNEPKKCSIYDVKPYLFPLSSMTEEQYNEMQTISGGDCLEHMEIEKECRNNSPFNHLPLYQYKVIEFFHKHHFDYQGLIHMGLAIDATGLNIY